MTARRGQPPDDVSSAPESGTIRDETSGSAPSDRGNAPPPRRPAADRNNPRPANADGRDDPSLAPEER
jgi:hypothetical protein